MGELRRPARAFVEAAKAAVPAVTPDELAAEREAGTVTVIDVRRPDERLADGAIPGAIHAERGGIEYYVDPASSYHKPGIEPGGRYVCHCSGGGRGAMAAARMAEMGYDDVAYLAGGSDAWAAAGYPMEPVEE